MMCNNYIDFVEFETAVLQMLIKLRGDVRELKHHVDQNIAMLQNLTQNDNGECELELPDGLELPMTTDSHIQLMEGTVDDSRFRRSLVSIAEA